MGKSVKPFTVVRNASIGSCLDQFDCGRAGLLMTYSSDNADGMRHAGAYVAKILAGTMPGDLPIEQASKFTLLINLTCCRGPTR